MKYDGHNHNKYNNNCQSFHYDNMLSYSSITSTSLISFSTSIFPKLCDAPNHVNKENKVEQDEIIE